MAHAVMAEIEPGDVVVLTMPEPAPVALVGELLATQAAARGAAALLVDAAVRDVEELAAMGLPIWARWVRIRGATKTAVGAIGEPVRGRRLRDPRGRRGRARRRRRRGRRLGARRRGARGGARARREGARQARGARGGSALLRPRRPPRPRREPLMAIPPDLAHIHHAELLTTRPEESLRFFVDVLGMEIESQEAGSVYLRGWGDYGRYSLKLSEAASTGLAHLAIRAWNQRGARPGRPSDRRDRARAGLDRRRSRTRPRLPLHGSRRARVRAPLRGRPLRAAARARALPEEPAAAVRRPRRRA